METIAAISTATANGGIGIIRMSGENCFAILQKIFILKGKKQLKICEIQGYTMKYGFIIDPDTNQIVDEVLVSFFKSPKSYTTENMCEINSHGGIVVERRILELCLKNGAVLAQPGEFTKKAFLNGRIDLAQAESIMDLINSKTEKEANASIKQLEGGLSLQIKSIRKDLLDIMADIEASIDYPEYDVEEVTEQKAREKLEKIYMKLCSLEESFQTGKILKEGIKTAIIGRPNAGKSSLLNSILREDRAIVSEIEGTTRDTIEEAISIRGIPLNLVDTAGIRKTNDKIEEIGVERALKEARQAELILFIIDNTKSLTEEDLEMLKLIKDKNAIIVLNKIDIIDNNYEEILEIKEAHKKIIKISAEKKWGIEDLYKEIEAMFELEQFDRNNGIIISNVRHKMQISISKKNIEGAIEQVNLHLPIDMVAISIKQALEELGKITGENVSEDIIQEIFSKFCLGK